MRVRSLFAVAVVALGPLLAPAAGRPKDDAELVQGSWDWDKAQKQEGAKPMVWVDRVVIKGDKLTFHYRFDDGRTWTTETKFTLDPKADPKEIDFAATSGDNKGQTYKGIYEVKAGELKFCYRGPGATRPSGFDDKRDPKTNTVTMTIFLKPTPND